MAEVAEMEKGMETQAEEGNAGKDNVVFIGKKPAMNYVLAVVTQFNNGAKNVTVKARGNAISRAVDVAEIVRARFLPDVKSPSKNGIAVSTEEISNEDGTKSKVSAIQLLLSADAQQQAEGQPAVDNTIYIGKKPTMNYVLAVVTQFNGGAKNVIVKARGNSISKAVDVAEIARNKFLQTLKNPSTANISITSEELTNEDGTRSKVSSILINLEK